MKFTQYTTPIPRIRSKLPDVTARPFMIWLSAYLSSLISCYPPLALLVLNHTEPLAICRRLLDVCTCWYTYPAFPFRPHPLTPTPITLSSDNPSLKTSSVITSSKKFSLM